MSSYDSSSVDDQEWKVGDILFKSGNYYEIIKVNPRTIQAQSMYVKYEPNGSREYIDNRGSNATIPYPTRINETGRKARMTRRDGYLTYHNSVYVKWRGTINDSQSDYRIAREKDNQSMKDRVKENKCDKRSIVDNDIFQPSDQLPNLQLYDKDEDVKMIVGGRKVANFSGWRGMSREEISNYIVAYGHKHGLNYDVRNLLRLGLGYIIRDNGIPPPDKMNFPSSTMPSTPSSSTISSTASSSTMPSTASSSTMPSTAFPSTISSTPSSSRNLSTASSSTISSTASSSRNLSSEIQSFTSNEPKFLNEIDYDRLKRLLQTSSGELEPRRKFNANGSGYAGFSTDELKEIMEVYKILNPDVKTKDKSRQVLIDSLIENGAIEELVNRYDEVPVWRISINYNLKDCNNEYTSEGDGVPDLTVLQMQRIVRRYNNTKQYDKLKSSAVKRFLCKTITDNEVISRLGLNKS